MVHPILITCTLRRKGDSRRLFLRKKATGDASSRLNTAPVLRLKPESVATLRSFVAAAPAGPADRAAFVGQLDVVYV